MKCKQERHGISQDEIQKSEKEIQDAKIRDRLRKIKYKLIIMSGKGGVGKSTIAAYLAVMLAKKGYKVGLMDVDLHGPSIPRLLGLKGNIILSNHQTGIPLSYSPNLQVISIEAFLPDKDSATIWRGPLKIGVIRQFISDIEWMDHLDFLIIDSPPGTGDEPLTVAQTIPDAMAIIVTTPQEVSLADVRKSITFCRQVNMQVLGLIENMSGFVCPNCGMEIDIFKKGGGEETAKLKNVHLLGRLPLHQDVVKEGDIGSTWVLNNPDHPFTKEFNSMVDGLIKALKDKEKIKSENIEKGVSAV